MNDIVPNGNYTPTHTLAKQGVTAIGCMIGGVGLLILGALPSVVGIVAGGVVGAVGVGAVLSKDPDDRKPGLLLAAAGGLAVLSKIGFLRPLTALSGTILGLGAVGLIGMGIWKGLQFLKGLKSRS